MRLNVRMTTDESKIPVKFGEVQTLNAHGGTGDYNDLENKPTINSVVLEGALTASDLGLGSVYYDTTANWNAQSQLIAEAGTVYIYSDYDYVEDASGNRTPIAGIRIGDGTSYLIDMPFVSDKTTQMIVSHVSNSDIHVTTEEKQFWNNKVSAYLSGDAQETLVLSKTNYEMNGVIISG